MGCTRNSIVMPFICDVRDTARDKNKIRTRFQSFVYRLDSLKPTCILSDNSIYSNSNKKFKSFSNSFCIFYGILYD